MITIYSKYPPELQSFAKQIIKENNKLKQDIIDLRQAYLALSEKLDLIKTHSLYG